MWNILKRPIEQDSFEAWAKISDDVTKVAMLTIPAILYSNDWWVNKMINIVLLIVVIYTALTFGRFFRYSKSNSKEG